MFAFYVLTGGTCSFDESRMVGKDDEEKVQKIYVKMRKRAF